MKTKVIRSNSLVDQICFLKIFFTKKSKMKEREVLHYFQSVCEFFKIYSNVIQCFEASLHTLNDRREDIIQVINSMKKGISLSNAFYNSGLLSDKLNNILKAGEKNGDLLGSFKLIVDFLVNKQKQKNKLINVMIYPIFTFLSFLFTIIVFSTYVIPSLIEFISDLHPKMISKFKFAVYVLDIIKYLIMIFFILSVSLLILKKYHKNLFERICIKIFIIRDLFVYSNLYFFSYYVYISLRNGLSIEESIDVASDPTSSLFKKIFTNIKKDLSKGCELSESLKKYNTIMPKFFIDIIKTGEKSNSLANSFEMTTKIFKNKKDNIIDTFTNIFPIILITIIGCFLIIFVYFFLFPLYKLGV